MSHFSYFSRCVSPPFARIGSPENSTDDQQISSKLNSPPPSNDSPIDMTPDPQQIGGRSVPIMTEIHSAIVAGADAETVDEIIGYDGSESSNDVNETVCGFTAIMLVCLYGGSVDTLKVLRQHGGELNMKDGHQCNILHFACFSGKAEIVEYIVEAALEGKFLEHLMNECDEWGNSAVHYVTRKPLKNDPTQNEQAIKIIKLLKENNCNVDIRNAEGQSPLHWAASNGNDKIVEELTSMGANPYSPDNSGLTPSQAASLHQSFTWETPNFLRLEGRENQSSKGTSGAATVSAGVTNSGSIEAAYLTFPNQALQGLDVLASFNSLPTAQVDLQRIALQLQQMQQPPQDTRTYVDSWDNTQFLYTQNQVMNNKVVELQRENLVLRERLVALENELQRYKVQLESSTQLLLKQYGAGINTLGLRP
eukprot:TRINITY_DN2133_c0_g4_i2.p1 TRINITY_DN2133_c0_g4~~TRINITY_DN2133_c0_g4_i2.p1  ORF type:complete len:422 (+),score=64.63 TRINITY_DN2133_c0_g4_i2:400-1665(+)